SAASAPGEEKHSTASLTTGAGTAARAGWFWWPGPAGVRCSGVDTAPSGSRSLISRTWKTSGTPSAIRWTKSRGPYQAYNHPIRVPRKGAYRPISVPEFMDHEVLRTLHAVKADKDPGTDGITDRVLQAAAGAPLQPVCPAWPLPGALPGCRYSRPPQTTQARLLSAKDIDPSPCSTHSASCLVALIASRMSYLAEVQGLLPDNHFGDPKGQGTENALHAALEVERRWWPPFCLTPPAPLIMSRMTDSCTTSVHAGPALCQLAQQLPPGSVHLASATGVYDADPKGGQRHPARLPPLANSLHLLQRGVDSAGGPGMRHRFPWRARQLSSAAGATAGPPPTPPDRTPSKFQLIRFHPPGRGSGCRRRAAHPGGQARQTMGPKRWKVAWAAKQPGSLGAPKACGQPRLQTIGALDGSKWGLRLRELRHVYTACITAIALYYAQPVRVKKRLHSQQANVLSRIQCWAGKLIAGAFRTVSGAAINTELHLTPMPFVLRQRHYPDLLRIPSTPAFARTFWTAVGTTGTRCYTCR
ncbi:hypothetical protein GB937_010647, partial [Aspergillus fischeri]